MAGLDLRLAMVTPRYAPASGDTARGARRLARHLADHGVEVVVFTGRHGDAMSETVKVSDEGVRVYRASSGYEGLVLFEMEESSRPFDLLHGFSLSAALTCLRLGQSRDRPLVVTLLERDGAVPLPPVRGLERVTWFAGVCGDVLRRVGGQCDVSGRSSVIPPGIDAERLPVWRSSEATAGVIGVTIDARRPETFRWVIDAYRRLPADLMRRLSLMDDPIEDADDSEDVQQMRCACALASDLEIRTASADGPDEAWYASLGAFVAPASHSGALYATRCAAAAGVPIVAADVDGVRDLLVPGVTASLVPSGDAAKLAEALRELSTDGALAVRRSRAARQAVANLTPAAECARYLDVYSRVLARQAPA